MAEKTPRFYVDWWNIRKSTVYSVAALIALLALFGGGVLLWRSGYFQPKTENAEFPKDTARIISFEGDVRVVRASTRSTYLAAGDTIQTQADGRAQIQMIDGSMLSVKPNSTVVIRDSASILGGTNVRVTLDEGQLNVKTQDKPETSENVVEMQESESQIAAQTDASFKINPETGGEIRISRGGVETNTGGDKRRRVCRRQRRESLTARTPVRRAETRLAACIRAGYDIERNIVSLAKARRQFGGQLSPASRRVALFYRRHDGGRARAGYQPDIKYFRFRARRLLLARAGGDRFGAAERLERAAQIYDCQTIEQRSDFGSRMASRIARRRRLSNTRQNAARNGRPRCGTRNFRRQRRSVSAANSLVRRFRSGRTERRQGKSQPLQFISDDGKRGQAELNYELRITR